MRVGLMLALGIAALAGTGCDWAKKKAPEQKSEKQLAAERQDRIRKACASEGTYVRLKDYVFAEAARIRNGDPRNLDPVAAGSVVRMEQPLVKSRDEALNVTVCTGKFTLELPPGAENAFDGLRRVSADVEYSAQAAADGSGLVYQMDGAEPIIYRLATFGLAGAGPMPRVVTMPQPSAPPAAPPQVAHAEILAPPVPEAARPARASAPAPAPRPAPAPGRRPVPAAAGTTATAPARAPARTATASARPSYNCRYARTTSEKLVCGTPALASKDSAMSSVYYSSIAGGDPATKRRIRASRDAFLARRERCAGRPNCIARVYDERVAEIRQMARE